MTVCQQCTHKQNIPNILCLCGLTEVDVGKDEEFMVSTQGAGGQGKLDVKITSPSRRPIPCKLESGTANEVHTVKYIAPEEGPYRVDISYDGNPVPGSPFPVEGVMPPDPSKVSLQTCFLFLCNLENTKLSR